MRKYLYLLFFSFSILLFFTFSSRPVFASQFDLNDKTGNGNTLTNHGATQDSSDTPFALSSY